MGVKAINRKISSLFGQPILTVELVPENCWCSNLRDHLTVDQWDSVRRTIYRKANRHCEICGGVGPKWPVECHEIWKYRIKKGQNATQVLKGLIALCPACHEVKHFGRAEAIGRRDEAIRHLAKVNKWKLPEAGEYIALIAEIWYRRNRYQWSLDLSWLKNHFGFDVEEKR